MVTVDAAFVAESAGIRMRVHGRGDTLTCRLDGMSLASLIALRRNRALLTALRTLIPMLVRSGLRVDISAGAMRLASIGSGVEQNAFARLLRLPHARVGR